MQVTGVVNDPPRQFQPGRFPEQSGLHPLLSSKFPSSQISPGFIIPSPQIGVHVVLSGLYVFTHVHPASMVQLEEHPSTLNTFPSSHYSAERINPSPHYPAQVIAVVGVPPPHMYPL